MAQRKRTEIQDALIAKGMVQDDSHHHMFRKDVDGVTTLVTRTSHNMKTVGDKLAKRMANQCCLTLGEFWDLVDCPLSEAEWDQLVAERCIDGRNPFMGF